MTKINTFTYIGYSTEQVCHCEALEVDIMFGAGPRLIVGATAGKLIVGGIAGSPDNVAVWDADAG